MSKVQALCECRRGEQTIDTHSPNMRPYGGSQEYCRFDSVIPNLGIRMGRSKKKKIKKEYMWERI